MTISLIISVRDEADNIGPLCERLRELRAQLPDDLEVIFVENHSTDGTADRIREQKDMRLLRIETADHRVDKATPIAAGLAHVQGDIVATIDGDLQNDPLELPSFINKCSEGYDVVQAWRRDRYDRRSIRLISAIGNSLRRLLRLAPVHDAGCGMCVMTSKAAQSLRLQRGLHRYIPDLLYLQGYHVTEVPISHRKRAYGRTKFHWTKWRAALTDLLRILWWRITKTDLSALPVVPYTVIEDSAQS